VKVYDVKNIPLSLLYLKTIEHETVYLELWMIVSNHEMFHFSKMNLSNKKFVTTGNKDGLSSDQTTFYNFQNGWVISGNYSGGPVQKGYVIWKLTDESKTELLVQWLTIEGELKAGH